MLFVCAHTPEMGGPQPLKDGWGGQASEGRPALDPSLGNPLDDPFRRRSRGSGTRPASGGPPAVLADVRHNPTKGRNFHVEHGWVKSVVKSGVVKRVLKSGVGKRGGLLRQPVFDNPLEYPIRHDSRPSH